MHNTLKIIQQTNHHANGTYLLLLKCTASQLHLCYSNTATVQYGLLASTNIMSIFAWYEPLQQIRIPNHHTPTGSTLHQQCSYHSLYHLVLHRPSNCMHHDLDIKCNMVNWTSWPITMTPTSLKAPWQWHNKDSKSSTHDEKQQEQSQPHTMTMCQTT